MENDSVLVRSFSDDPRYHQSGTFYLHEVRDGKIQISFIPSQDHFGFGTDQEYQVLIRLNVLSGNTPGRFAVVLVAGMLIFLGILYRKGYFSQKISQANKDNLLTRILRKIQTPGKCGQPLPWKNLIMKSGSDIVLLVYLFMFLEWLFIITMPSFMDYSSFHEKVRIFLSASLIGSVVVLFLLFLLLILAYLLTRFKPGIRSFLAGIPFAFLASCLVFLLLDNFLTTVFSTGIAGSSAIVRILWSIFFIGFFLYMLIRTSSRYTEDQNSKTDKINKWLTIGLLGVSIPFAISTVFFRMNHEEQLPIPITLSARPNIILISSDGLDASHMSVYGYELDTTPFLRELAASSLVSENNFPNTDHTWGSETSVLTGRYPFVTRVLFSPDILRGDDKFLHLPGILKNNGYKTISLGVPYYNNANDINFHNAFDVVNCSEQGINITQTSWYSRFFEQERYLLYLINKRVIDRLSHIFFIKTLYKPFFIVNDFAGRADSDQARLNCLQKYLLEAKGTKQPIFAQIHQMGTHGPTFGSIIHRFSIDQKQDRVWMPEFYDDSIINFDSDMATLVENLKSLGIYQDTIIILYTDHGTEWSSNKRLPLILHFPNDHGKGKILGNTQNIDIAPTILDYLGIEIPHWMDGSSLLSPIPRERIAFSVDSIEPIEISGLWTMPKNTLTKPFQQLESIKAIQCQNITSLDLENYSIGESEVEKHTAPCSVDTLNTRVEMINKFEELLHRAGYLLPEDWKKLK